ncbi:hypothetical protein ABZ721_33180 [Streptomyces sp. NPDC006733]|uniref:hypothetical protein n=1 Tax=Streptomyces sp. NPDC006733 TaxID=3155460 RepID=UPI0033F780A7
MNEARIDRAEHRRLDTAAIEPTRPCHDDAPTPKVLSDLLRYHTTRVTSHLNDAMDNSRYYEADFTEWQRLVLYKHTDGLEHYLLLVGAIAGFLRGAGVPSALLRRYLQVRDDQSVEALLTPKVLDHVAGLTGEIQSESSRPGIWYEVGQGIAAQDGWCHPQRDDAVEAFHTALFRSDPEDEALSTTCPNASANMY